MNRLRCYLLLWTGCFFATSAQAQLTITPANAYDNSAQLVKEVFASSGVEIGHVRFRGARHAVGTFTDSTRALGMSKGIILTTGSVFDVPGPNRRPNTTGRNGAQGDLDLQTILRKDCFDAISLEFKFKPFSDTVVFNYIFASEEYPEFVGSPYNDFFAMLISGPGIQGYENIALLPGKGTIISVNKVNHSKNPNYFVDNYSAKADPALRQATEFDGFTTVLQARYPVQRGRVYTIKIAIADVNDPDYDSAVLLEAGSFRSVNANVPEQVIAEVTLNIKFDTDSWVVPSSAEDALLNIHQQMMNNPGSHLEIVGHTDNEGSELYNQKLSTERALAVLKRLVEMGAEANLISARGAGASEPIADNNTAAGRAKNRRVEFVLKKQ